MNKVGSKVWVKGDEVTITSEPFFLHGGEFQKAVTESGKEIVVATKAQATKNAKAAQDAWNAQQAEFRKL